VDFKNVILIMTSNIGADRIMSQDPFGFMKRDANIDYQKMKEMLTAELERNFRPEFINRIDEVVVFHKLTRSDLSTIIDLELSKVNARLKERGLALQLTEEARDLLLEKGTDDKFGARPLRRTISQLIEDPLSEDILRNKHAGMQAIRVGVSTDEKGEKHFAFEGLKTPEVAAAAPPAPSAKSPPAEPVATGEST
jgi:ATP-dependent Clp protease ATP-binding subunit ClpC